MFQQITLVPSGLGAPAHRGRSIPALGGQMLRDDCNGTGGISKNEMQILGECSLPQLSVSDGPGPERRLLHREKQPFPS
jgi:hypothetical protein